MTPRGFVVGDRILGQAADSHADWCAAYGQLGAYRFVGASAIGKLHLRDVRPRDDAFAVRSAGAWLAVAVSDGAGSRPQSRYGASFAVEALCEQLLREATGVTSPPEIQSAESASTADGNEKPTQVESIAPQEAAAHSEGGFPAQAAPKAEVSYPLPAFDVPPMSAPSDEAASTCGTLTWHWQPPAPNREGEAPAEPVAPPERRPPAEPAAPAEPAPVGSAGALPSPPPDLGECVRRAFQRTRQGLKGFAQSRGVALRELHCTLIGLLLNTETGAVAVGHIGDGLAAMFHPGMGAQPLVEAPTPGEVGETYVLTQSDWEKYLSVRALSPKEAEGITTFYLMTDGVADDCTHPPPEDIFQRWARDIDREVRKEESLPQTATRLLRWLATHEVRGSWDDRTLVVVMRDSGL
jgi:serine/threonine protein phosphatase PrpC